MKPKTNNTAPLNGQIAANGKLKKRQGAGGPDATDGTGIGQSKGPKFHKLPANGGPAGDKVSSGNPHRQLKQQAQMVSRPEA
ncbi:hypothetical protein [Mesorhizobium sp. BH1-1-4]|uniref:hypothetical protein n=1 Tax=Mesorhizobium sp. BH1-1-4 TaxID=2876662 RepID=UPI001CD077C4|nr:hypothetical protein [Mesorhizobium sp. BH1-1-4]MBZ9995318.1 hypothetical protein [Mesorhizobium sp. BH1-1-4]